MKPPIQITSAPKITLADGTIFTLKPGETVDQALTRADAMEKQGIKPKPPSKVKSKLSYDDDSLAQIMEAKDRVKAGSATEDDKLVLALAHGSGKTDEATIKSTCVGTALRKLIGRVECVAAEIKDLQDDRKEIYKEVAIFGFDVAAVKRVVRKRKLERAAREEMRAIDDLYLDVSESGTGADAIPLPGLPSAKKARKKSQARIKKDAARDAQLAEEKAAREAAARHTASLSGGG